MTLRWSHKSKRIPATSGMRSQLASRSTLKSRSNDRYHFFPNRVNRFTFGRSSAGLVLLAREGLSMTINSVTIKTTALYAFGFVMLVVLATLVWTSAQDVALALYAFADI